MESVKKEIPSEKVDKFFVKEFGKIPKGTVLPSEIFHNSSAPLEERFIEIAQRCFSTELSTYKAGTMICRFERFL